MLSLNDSYSSIDFKGIGKFGTGPIGVAGDGREALMAASCLRVKCFGWFKISLWNYCMINKFCNLPLTEPQEATCNSTNSFAFLLKSRLGNWPVFRKGEIVGRFELSFWNKNNPLYEVHGGRQLKSSPSTYSIFDWFVQLFPSTYIKFYIHVILLVSQIHSSKNYPLILPTFWATSFTSSPN